MCCEGNAYECYADVCSQCCYVGFDRILLNYNTDDALNHVIASPVYGISVVHKQDTDNFARHRQVG